MDSLINQLPLVAETVLQRLAPDQRVAVVMALVGLGILGVLLVVLTILAGRWARRGTVRRPDRLGLGAKPQAGEDDGIGLPDERHSGETLAGPHDGDETQVER